MVSNYKKGLDRDVMLHPTSPESDKDAEFDLVSVLHGKLAEMVTNLPENLRSLSEFELCDKVDPGPTDYKMRQNFSEEVERAKLAGRKIVNVRIYEDLVSRQTFFDWYLCNPLKVAFFTRPVVTHNHYYDALHKEGLRKLFIYGNTTYPWWQLSGGS